MKGRREEKVKVEGRGEMRQGEERGRKGNNESKNQMIRSNLDDSNNSIGSAKSGDSDNLTVEMTQITPMAPTTPDDLDNLNN